MESTIDYYIIFALHLSLINSTHKSQQCMHTHPLVQFWNIKESACTCTLGKMDIQISDINETLLVPLDFSVTKTKLNNQESRFQAWRDCSFCLLNLAQKCHYERSYSRKKLWDFVLSLRRLIESSSTKVSFLVLTASA